MSLKIFFAACHTYSCGRERLPGRNRSVRGSGKKRASRFSVKILLFVACRRLFLAVCRHLYPGVMERSPTTVFISPRAKEKQICMDLRSDRMKIPVRWHVLASPPNK